MKERAQIRHIVHLMLENRSLDNVLGWLYETELPAHVIPPDSCPRFDGLHAGLYNLDGKGKKHPVIRGTGGRHAMPRYDPDEEFQFVNNQLFGSEETPKKPAIPKKPAKPAECAPSGDSETNMGGFYKDYAKWYRNNDEIMMSYTPDELPVLNSLARRFAVSDRYFASVPTQTNCNRAFAAAGNSLGVDDQGRMTAWVNNRNSNWLARPGGVQFSESTIWNVLCEQGQDLPSDWMIFHSRGSWLQDDLGAEGYSYTRRIMQQLQDPRFDNHFAEVGSGAESAENTLFGMIAGGTLPRFSFIEPSWTLPLGPGLGPNGTDYHPPGDIRKGERFLKDLYDALSSNPDIWDSLLFIINFDEHGGTYDHVPPPWTAAPPWSGNSDTPTPELYEQNFKFDRFGVRVPLILVSPFVRTGTVFRAEGEVPFDHTSVSATILHLLGVDRQEWRLGARMDSAPLFDHVLTELPTNADPDIGNPKSELPDMSERLYDALEADYPDHGAGLRPVHAVGIGVTGSFSASEAAKHFTFAEQFQGGHIPVTVRFSNGSGSPTEHDSALDVRGMAVKFHLQNGGESDLIGITLPIFFAQTPEEFLQFAAAGVPEPDPPETWLQRLIDMLQLRSPARRPDFRDDGTAGVVHYANTHMAARPGTVAATMLVTPSSYARAEYHALHTFKLIANDGTETFARFEWDPVAGVMPFLEKGVHDRYLHQELADRLNRGPVRFVLRINLAGQGDDINDPTKVWDTTRPRIVLGELWLTALAGVDGAGCEHLSFNPTRLAPGLACSDDPVLAARRDAYQYSCEKRGGSGCPFGRGSK